MVTEVAPIIEEELTLSPNQLPPYMPVPWLVATGVFVVDPGYTLFLFDENDGDRGEARGCHFLVYSNLSCVDRFGISLPFVLMLRYRPPMSCSVKEFCPSVQ